MSIRRAVAFAQGKGGVGKTTLTSNVAGLAAKAGYKTLVVDLDQQGNIARDLGFEPDSGDDLMSALVSAGTPLPIKRDVRENLDVVPGGPAIGDAAAMFAARASRAGGVSMADALEEKLGAIADDYQLILFDTPPGDRIIVEATLAVVSAVAIPTRMDEASIDGVARIAERFVSVRDRNPDLRLAGVVLFAITSRTTRLERDVREALEQILGGAAPVFDTRIRHLDSAAADARRRGLLVHELEQANVDDRKKRLKALRDTKKLAEEERREKLQAATAEGLYSTNASGLAEDYESFTRELLMRLAEIEAELETVQ